MMERKFTYDEIVKALECCSDTGCEECPINNKSIMCATRLMEHALDLINRQKAEIKRLKEAYAIYEETTGLKWARAEAIKEFAERWKKYWKAQMDVSTNQHQDEIVLRDIDNLVKEMTGEYNGN